MSVREVAIRDAEIRLGQFLKLADLVDTGADAKAVLADGRVSVNGDVETRRGRRLVPGDLVTLTPQNAPDTRTAPPAQTVRVTSPPA